MAVTRINLVNFRNLETQEIEFPQKNSFFIGENGQGKTNLLEAVYLLCYGRSFRERQDRKIIRFGEAGMGINGTFLTSGGITHKVKIKYENGIKSISLDSGSINDRKDLIYLSPCIIFSHDDISYIKGPMLQKRHLLNQILGLYDPVYLEYLRNYSKTVRIKNSLLKKKEYELIPLYHKQISEFGIELQQKRQQCIEEFNTTLTSLFSDISELPGNLYLEYNPSWKDCANSKDSLIFLNERLQEDKKYYTSTCGPHRDRIIIRYDSRDFSSFCSTGQTRLIALLLKVAQTMFFYQKTGKKPILLLDDVFLEMDPKRKEKFLDVFPEYEQAFFTFLPGDSLLGLKNFRAISYHVENGRISQK